MGARGPVPKRSDKRLGHQSKAQRAAAATVAPAGESVRLPAGEWSTGITQWYDSLEGSGQSRFYVSSDWASAWLMCEAMNAELSVDGVLRSATLSAWLKLCASLLVTEGDRRRAAIELFKPTPPALDADGAEVTDIRAWREALN